jgi:hypothetical protein
MQVRARRLAVLAAACVAVATPSQYDSASASCAGPALAVGDQVHPLVSPGQRVIVTGHYFVDGCNDTRSVEVSPGCAASEQREPVAPLDDIALSIRQHGRAWRLGIADATGAGDASGRVTWVVRLPTDLEPGRAALVTHQSLPLRVTVVK